MSCNIYQINSAVSRISIQRITHSGISVSEFTAEFLKIASADRRAGTMKIYKSALSKFIDMTTDIPLDEVTARHYDKFKSMRAVAVRPVTVNIDLRALRAAFQTAVRWKYLAKNPFEDTRLIPVPQTEKPFIRQDDFPRLISAIQEPWMRDIVFFAALTGLRREELICLTKADYEVANKQVVIKSNANFKTKNGKMRVVPLDPAAQYIVQSHIELNQSKYLFYLDGGIQISGDYLTHKFKKYVRLVGLGEDIHLHSLRHTYASWLVQNGANLFQVQRLLGHGCITTTQVYAHLSMNELRSAVLNLPDFKELYDG